MKASKTLITLSLMAFICGCSDDSSNPGENTGHALVAGLSIQVESSITQQYSGNIESVRVVEGRALPSAIAVSSKTKTIRYLERNGAQLKPYLPDYTLKTTVAGTEDNEFTNSAVYDVDHSFVTYTKLTKNDEDKITHCAGSLIMVKNISDSQHSATEVKETITGPMPDAVAISPDKKYILTADEYDGTDTWGKCPLGNGQPSVSIIHLENTNIDTDNIKVSKTIKFTKNALDQSREPEYIAIASDSNTVAVTLQDSYEVALFRLSEIMAKDGDTVDESAVKFVDIPANSAGVKSWPDGIVAMDIDHKHYFAMAGEGSDSIIIIDDEGKIMSNTQITEKEVPTTYPCFEADWFPGTKYSPDSITAFTLNNKTYVAATLRYAGAIIIYNVTNPSKPEFELITHAGVGDIYGDGICSENTSKVYPEGIASGVMDNAAYIWVANEGDSSVTVLKVVVK